MYILHESEYNGIRFKLPNDTIMTTYHFSRKSSLTFDKTIQKLTEELQKEGFGVLTNIDLRETFKKKLDIDFRNYTILGACNPLFAHKAISFEPTIGVMLPCNIAVQENEQGEVIVSAINPMETMAVSTHNAELESVAEEVSTRLNRVVAAC